MMDYDHLFTPICLCDGAKHVDCFVHLSLSAVSLGTVRAKYSRDVDFIHIIIKLLMV